MLLTKLRIWIFIFIALLGTLDAKKCPKGQKVAKSDGNVCEVCSKGYFQPKENESQKCEPCTLCDVNAGSEMKHACTKDTDTVCQCRGDFVVWDNDTSICKCEIGFGLSSGEFLPECLKCKEGYFSAKKNTACSKWNDCHSTGVKIPGSMTSDAICNNDSTVAKPRTSNKTEFTSQRNHPPHEGARTSMMLTTILTRTPQKTTMEENVIPTQPSERGNHNDWIFILLGIAGFVLILTVVSYKKDVIPCWLRKTTEVVQKKDSACRRPVEESGDNSESSLKLSPEEP